MIELREACFSYDGRSRMLDDVTLGVAPGERVVVLGLNGSGKSTLGRLCNASLFATAGAVVVDGVAARPESALEVARLVGMVRQDPRDQVVSSLVADEVAFGPRNLGLPRDEVRERVDEALGTCGISGLRERMTTELSGGQQQLLALAGVLAMRPRYLVLDEVCAQLDGTARRRVRALVDELVERGLGVLEVAHDAAAVFGAARVVVLEAGRVAWSGEPRAFFASEAALKAAGLGSDPMARAWADAAMTGYEIGPRADVEGLAAYLCSRGDEPRPRRGELCPGSGAHRLTLSDVCVAARAPERAILDRVSLDAPGSLTLLLGATGSGKTTTARVAAGVLDPDAGSATLDGAPVRAGAVGLAFQRPDDQLLADTVLDDIAYAPRMAGLGEDEALARARSAAGALGVGEGLFDRSPFELSGGQARRVALAGVVAARQGAVVLDEPTAGLDAPSRGLLHDVVADLVARGVAVVVVTHDAGEWLDEARAVVLLAGGCVVARATGAEAAADPALFERAGLVPPPEVRLRAALAKGAADA
ncbi:ABC transporter ATP-binding protein [Thermophilibacter sp.]